jgi:hypothetical protein
LKDEKNQAEAVRNGSTSKRRWWQRTWVRVLAIVVVVGAAALVLGLDYFVHHASPILRKRLVQTLSSSFNTTVELDQLSVSIFNGIQVRGGGLRIPAGTHPEGANTSQEIKPLLSIDHFAFRTSVWNLLRRPTHVVAVDVQGMEMHIPPDHDLRTAFNGSGANHHKPRTKISLTIGEIHATNVKLFIETDKAGKEPLEFDIDKLNVTRVGPLEASTYAARLINPTPRGLIQAQGHFGPWNSENPRQTPVSGDFTFSNADMSTIKGLGGTLQGRGHYNGVLDHLMVDGTANVPNFSLDTANHPMRLETRYHAFVNGANGNTYLDPVQAVLGHSSFTCRGQVVKVDRAGHDIQVDVDMPDGRIEDMLQLAMKTVPPVMRGAVHMKARLNIPPGNRRVAKKMQLAGQLSIDNVEFGNAKLQDRVDGLSMRAQGKPAKVKEVESDRRPEVASETSVHFSLANAMMTVSSVRYRMPGATIQLHGVYSLDGSVFEFKGHVRTAAEASQMVTGWKSWLLKPLDPFLRKNGAGLELPISISGTNGDVHFGLALTDSDESTGAMKQDVRQKHSQALQSDAAKRLNDKADREDIEASKEKDLKKAETIHNQAVRDHENAQRQASAAGSTTPNSTRTNPPKP